tara:strand:+ start:6918 stop:7364 length:447 start_codon:yes stop_codon:yes gene_type:complete
MRDLNTILDELLDYSSALEHLRLGEQLLLLGILGAVLACILFAFCWDGDSINKTRKELSDKTTRDLAPDLSQAGRSLYKINPITTHQSTQQSESTKPSAPSRSSTTKIMQTPIVVTAGRNLYLVGVIFIVTGAMFSVILAASKRWLKQ